MKLFSKNNDDQLELDIFSDSEASGVENNKESKVKAPHVLTRDEVLSANDDNPSVKSKDSKSALDALKARVRVAAQEATHSIRQSVEPKREEPKPAFTIKEDNSPKPFVTEEIKVIKPELQKNTETETKSEIAEEPKPSLYDKCKPFLLNEDGTEDKHLSKPLYELQSIADILKNESKDALDRLSDYYKFDFDNSGKVADTHPTKKAAAPIVKKAEEKPEVKEPTNNRVKNPQSNVAFVISDIDVPNITETSADANTPAPNATITFTPVNDGRAKHIAVSTNTRQIDLTGEIAKVPDETPEIGAEVKLESNEFEEFIPKEEIDSEKMGIKIVRRLAISKRNKFLALVSSCVLMGLLLFLKLPFMDGFFIENTKAVMTVCTVITGLVVLVNADMLRSFKRLFSKEFTPDIILSLASVTTLVYSGFAIKMSERFYSVLLLLSFVLLVRAFCEFFKASSILMGAKIVSSHGDKTAVRLINDPAVTFAMAKNAVDGDVMIAAPQKTAEVKDFMKYSTYGKFFGGKFYIIILASLLLAVLSGFVAYSYFGNIAHGLYAAAVILLLAAAPPLFLIDVLPFYRASRKLYANHGCICGRVGAQTVEIANAVVVEAADIFPRGTVTLHQLQPLSDNDLEDTLVRAAALTESISSPLAPIFKKIARSGNIEALPDSDTVKYEERMGISGWVDNRLLFIGNRTLLEAHGIEVPSMSVDMKILRQGYFPVYLATQDKACALLLVQYSVDGFVQKELQKLTKLGVTVLVNSCDPNLTSEMICDYLSLYSDSVHVMATVGSHVFKNTMAHTERQSSPAVFKGGGIILPAILNAAARIKGSNLLLSIMYIFTAVLGVMVFVYASFAGSASLFSADSLLIYSLSCSIITYLLYLFKRP